MISSILFATLVLGGIALISGKSLRRTSVEPVRSRAPRRKKMRRRNHPSRLGNPPHHRASQRRNTQSVEQDDRPTEQKVAQS